MSSLSVTSHVSNDVFPSLHFLYDFVDSHDIHNKVLLKNPVVPCSIVAFYVLLVTWIGPLIMKSHKPFNLQKILIMYNLLQAIANSYIAYNIIKGVSENWDSRCRVRNSPKLDLLLQKAMEHGWQLYLIKFADLLDTVFFVLRKKQNQVSFLHVFHHAGMCLLFFWGLHNIYRTPGFYMAIGFGINTTIHVIMYSYYCLAAFGPHMQKYLWWKRHLTRLQIGQIFFILFYMIVAFLTGCEEFGKDYIAKFAKSQFLQDFGASSKNKNMTFNQIYDFLYTTEFERKGIVSNPYISTSIVVLYLLFIIWIGPTFMSSRKPYSLKTILIFYNFLQAAMNAYVVCEAVSILREHWHVRCMVKNNPKVKEILLTTLIPFWHYYLLKFVDLLDTVFFVLRKKQNQVTFLHVVHHAGLCIILNWGLRNADKASAFYIAFGFTINAAVHIIMYSYYGLAACGPNVRKYLWWKKYLTLVQIVQIFLILAYMFVGFVTGCEEFGTFEQIGFAFVALNFYLFVNFYRKYKTD
ncbi:elongation of very long chain fatty acids protein 4 [Nephila pilipes]|uniref:Elongation of very long chain fatty acids protein n=1 Tax=Nephila pilipes TaxID=299642 RepID=A0A8X6PC77_NEPPI|nr:elongation of very long chain fatty acids protein 4 [Nephila pilipes]